MWSLKRKMHLACLGVLVGVSTASAETFVVLNNLDGPSSNPPSDSLRQMLRLANNLPGRDTIDLRRVSGTITLTAGELLVVGETDFIGPGANRLTISGGNSSRVFNFHVSGITETLTDLTIAHGLSPVNDSGGGILNYGDLAVVRCVIENNTARVSGGGILNEGHLTVVSTSITGNSASIGGAGGAIRSVARSSLKIVSSLLANNSAISGGAIEYTSPILGTLTNVTVSGNTSTGDDTGAVFARAGGKMHFDYCTIVGNVSGRGNSGGLRVDDSSSQIAYHGTIIAGNTIHQIARSSICCFSSEGFNMSSDATGSLTSDGDQPNTDPFLGPLANNGGPTLTHALLSGSPAIDRGDPFNFPSLDQRGISRPRDGNNDGHSFADIGAFERP